MKINLDKLNELPLPHKAIEYLIAIAENEQNIEYFIKHIKPQFTNVYIALSEFRLEKFNIRNFTFEEFVTLYEIHPQIAIEKLFLYPYKKILESLIIEPIKKGQYTLVELYNCHLKNQLCNPVLVGKELLQLSKLP